MKKKTKHKSRKTNQNKGQKARVDAKLGDRLLQLLNAQPQNTFSFKALCKQLKVRSRKDKLEFEGMLIAFQSRDLIVRHENGMFQSAYKSSQLVGRVDHVNPKFAYIVIEEREEDVWVATDKLHHAIDGDKVEIKLIPSRRRNRVEGEVVEILERTKSEVIGTVAADHRFAFIIPSDRKIHNDIFISNSDLNGAKDGQRVIAEILEWRARDKNPVGRVNRVLGEQGENNAEIHAIMFQYGLPFNFPPHVKEASEKIPTEIPAQEVQKRRDMREVPTFTIDPLTAKDFDDALSVQPTIDGNWEIGIHIADVTHYVKPGSILDKEAFERATSVYLVDRTVPMLPEKLSNELCSLRPNEDKCTFSAVFTLDKHGRVLTEWFGRTLTHSDRRFTYEEAQEVIETEEGPFAEEVLMLNRLAHKLRQQRFASGAIGFETTEFVFELDEAGKPLGMVAKIRKDAHKLVEEFMLLANRKVATFVHELRKKDAPPPTMVYRTHDSPDPEKVETFARFAKRFGFKINTEEGALAASLNSLASALEGLPEQNIIESQAIRTMAKAKYTTDPLGHYGLAFQHYTHFTSPIRRYPDMMVHRLLAHYLSSKEKNLSKSDYEEKCVHSSDMERKAAEAERASIKYKQVEFMQQYLDKELEGVISGVTEWGIFVEAEETRCEGMVRLNSMQDDFYSFDEETMSVVGRKYKNTYQIGDRVRILVKATDINRRTIDFEMLT